MADAMALRVPAPANVSMPISAFPLEAHNALRELDTDGSGDISVSELVTALAAHAKVKKQNKALHRYVIGLAVGGLVFAMLSFGVVFAASIAVVRATETLRANADTLQSLAGVTLRTAGGSTTTSVESVASRRALAAHPHGRSLVASLDFVSDEDGDDDHLVHMRRPVWQREVTWDAHGRALQAKPPRGSVLNERVDRTKYVTVGTTSSSSATDMCKFINEGQSTITVLLNIDPTGQVTSEVFSYVVSSNKYTVYGCRDFATNGYGMQGLMNEQISDIVWASGAPNSVILIDCPRYSPPTITSCAVSVPLYNRTDTPRNNTRTPTMP